MLVLLAEWRTMTTFATLRFCQITVAVLVWTSIVGCSEARMKPVTLVRVRGVVTFKGKALEQAVVVFESQDGAFSYAQTDSRGRYDLRCDSRTRGVTPGTKTVRISMNRRIHGLNSHDEGGPEDRAGGAFPKQPAELIPDKYNLASTLIVNVASDTRRFDFDIQP